MHCLRLCSRVLFVSVVLLLNQSLFAFRSDPQAGENGSTASGGATCLNCHTLSGPPGTGAVQILGAPPLYYPNQSYDLTIRVSDPVQAGAGFQLSVEDPAGNHVGTLIITDTDHTQYNMEDAHWVNQTATGVDDSVIFWASQGNSADYHVRWRAPGSNIGPIDFWAVGNAINNNHSRTGDHIYTTQVTATFDLSGVPTIGEWGAVAMSLAFIVAAGMVIQERRRA